jgi:hypothetical protein
MSDMNLAVAFYETAGFQVRRYDPRVRIREPG